MKPDQSPYATRRVQYETLHSISSEQFDVLYNAIAISGEQRILDCGAGYGGATISLLERKKTSDVVHIDLLDESITQLSQAYKNLRKWNSDVSVTIRYIEGRFPDGPFSVISFSSGAVTRTPLAEAEMLKSYGAVICKMVLHDIPQGGQTEFLNGLARCLEPGGRLLLWDMLIPSITAPFVRAAVRKKDQIAGLTALDLRRYLFSSDELYNMLADTKLRDVTPQIHFNYRFNTRQRIGEFGNDSSKIVDYEDALRSLYDKDLPLEAQRQLAITDTASCGIEFNIPMGILSAFAPDGRDYLLRPMTQEHLDATSKSKHIAQAAEMILQDREGVTLNNNVNALQGLLRLNAFQGSKIDIPEITGGLDYLIGKPTDNWQLSRQHDAARAYLLYLCESFYRNIKGAQASTPLGISPFLQKTFSRESGCMWLSVRLLGPAECELRVGGYSIPIGLYNIASAQPFSSFGIPMQLMNDALNGCDINFRHIKKQDDRGGSLGASLSIANGTMDEFAARTAATWHEYYYKQLDPLMPKKSDLSLSEIFPGPYVSEIRNTLLPALGLLCKFMEFANLSETHYVIPPSVVREAGRTDSGSATICLTKPVEINNFLGVVEALIGLWTSLGYVIKENAFEKLIESQHRAAKAALMTRNFSHNIGSHAMANDLIQVLRSEPFFKGQISKPVENEFQNSRKNFDDKKAGDVIGRDFDRYVQGRQDFIATVVERDIPPPQEPMFFWGDVLRPFVQQYALLSTMLADQGYGYAGNKKPIRWTVELPSGDSDCDQTANAENFYEVTGKDVLVGIPGGTAGNHAFYAILENLLRNAVKNGDPAEELHVTLSLKEDEDRYMLSVRTNLSSKDVLNAVVGRMRPHLNESLSAGSSIVLETGHGMHEIRECAEYLVKSGDARKFESDDALKERNAPSELEKPYFDFLNDYKERLDKSADRGSQKETAVRCYFSSDSPKQIVYQFVLAMPCLVGVCDIDKKNGKPVVDGKYVRYVDDLSQLMELSPHIGVIETNSKPPEGFMVDLDNQDLQLPFRLMLLCKDEKIAKLWRDELHDFAGGSFRYRLPICFGESFAEVVTENGESEACLKCNDVWIRSLRTGTKIPLGEKVPPLCFDKPAEDEIPLGLRVIFERDGGYESIETAWHCVAAFPSSWLKLQILKEDKTLIATSDKSGPFPSDDNVICFANHKLDQDSIYEVYHAFGVENISLHQRMEHVPREMEAFRWFVYSLIEAALVRIVIFDERVLESVRERGDLIPWNMAKVFPVSRACNGSRMEDEFIFKNRVETSEGFGELDIEEAMDFTNEILKILAVQDGDTEATEVITPVHIVALHRGMIEQAGEHIIPRGEKLAQKVRQVASRVVILLGRGTGGKEFAAFPFAEVSSLGSLHCKHFDKFRIGKSLMA